MFSSRELVLTVLLAAAVAAQAQPSGFAGIGRPATAAELASWDIDVRPDFKGLPKGSGSVAQGMVVWESQCASCHGIFGESNQVFSPMVGGTTAQDIESGRAARLNDAAFPGRTTLMKLPTLATLWDYIRRAMPWAQPKSLSTQEVYAVTAYILHLGGIVPEQFVLSDANIAAVQERLPNRDGMTGEHALWPGAGRGSRQPDVRATACMLDCAAAPALASYLPEHARDAHGNLAEQNRAVGAQRGANTVQPTRSVAVTHAGSDGSAEAALALTQKLGCAACHGLDKPALGPSFRELAKKYGGRADGVAYLAGKIKSGGSGVWGAMRMPPQSLAEADAQVIAQWVSEGAKK